GKRPPLLPWFAVAFGVLVLVNSLVVIPKGISGFFGEISRFLLVTAIAAIGMKTQLKELTVLGWRPVILIVSETLFLAILIVLVLQWVR
ncbi:MAG: putative sulfate exporter family transporter, partial [Rhodocyclaceae bacterium]|nr:putative sulfate exporter family transporter [Rhodocyclaceae bacterium]